jgi:hypothetical protein
MVLLLPPWGRDGITIEGKRIMSILLTLERAQDILLEAHTTVTQVQDTMFVWFKGDGGSEGPCFCVMGLLGYELGVLTFSDGVIYDWNFKQKKSMWIPTSEGQIRFGSRLDQDHIEDDVFEAMGLPVNLAWEIIRWNDKLGWSFKRISTELSRFWDDVNGVWLDYIPANDFGIIWLKG